MDNNGITSDDFNYDIYTGGSGSGSSSDNGVTSTNFDYDVYSGSAAKEYLRQQNEREREERERSKKTAAELRREEYEKKFANMSADELMAAPVKKKKPEDDFSDFFDGDEIQRRQEELKKMEQEKIDLPEMENMQPGEDSPSSETTVGKNQASIQDAYAMMARARMQRERAEERRQTLGGYGGRRYYRRRYSPIYLLYESFSSNADMPPLLLNLLSYAFWAIISGLIFLPLQRVWKLPQISIVAFGCFVGMIIMIAERYNNEDMTFGEAVKASLIEIALFLIFTVITVGTIFF